MSVIVYMKDDTIHKYNSTYYDKPRLEYVEGFVRIHDSYNRQIVSLPVSDIKKIVEE